MAKGKLSRNAKTSVKDRTALSLGKTERSASVNSIASIKSRTGSRASSVRRQPQFDEDEVTELEILALENQWLKSGKTKEETETFTKVLKRLAKNQNSSKLES